MPDKSLVNVVDGVLKDLVEVAEKMTAEDWEKLMQIVREDQSCLSSSSKRRFQRSASSSRSSR
jgi:hypothetical protein